MPRYPKTLTIVLPELQREALQQISNREPRCGPAELLEAVLAAGLTSKILSYPEALEETCYPKDSEGVGVSKTSPSLHLHLDSGRTERVLRILSDRPSRTPEELAMWMLEWGLDAYEETLQLVEPSDAKGGRSDP